MLKEAFEELLAKLVPAAQACYGERLVTLAVYGSVGRGTMRFDSDVDVLLIVRDLPQGRRKRREGFVAVEDALTDTFRELRSRGVNTELMPAIKTPEEVEIGSPLFFDMVDDARILYDRNGFLHGDSTVCVNGWWNSEPSASGGVMSGTGI